MRAVTISSFGEPEVLTVAEVPDPVPGEGQVRVRVQAAPVHPADVATRAGALSAFLPERPQFVLGWDFAGTVEEIGSGVTGFAPGDAVIGLSDWFVTLTGTQAEQVVLDARAIAAAPKNATPQEAATLPLNGLTALQSLELFDLTEGDTLAVVGAAGGVGAFVTELAVARGLDVLGVAGPDDEELVTGLGATFVPRTDDVAAALRAARPGGVKALYDTPLLGAPALAAVQDNGVYINTFGPAAPESERGIRVGSISVHSDGEQLAQLAGLVESGRLTLRVADTYPLDQAAQAHARFAKGGVRGHLVLVV